MLFVVHNNPARAWCCSLGTCILLNAAVLAPAATLQFTNVTQSAGITHTYTLLQNTGEADSVPAGAVAEDFNGDGWIDLYLLQSGGDTNSLYINLGNGTFREEGASRGAALTGEFMGAAAADYDNDGDIDICVTRARANPYLLINTGDGHFITDTTSLSLPNYNSMSPSWGDIDNDGFLELAVGQWAFEGQNLFMYKNDSGQLTLHEFRREPSEDRFAFSPRFADVNNDGLMDLAVASDFRFSQLFLNEGSGRFSRVTATHGVGSDENGMGSAIGDYDNDGDLDWFVSSIYDEGIPERNWGTTGNRLYRNRGDGTFEDATDTAGVRDGSWGWGSAFGDFDLDGDLDLYHVNGWPSAVEPTVPLKWNLQPARLFVNQGGGSFVEQAGITGADHRGQGRGLALLDYDNDGDLDIFIGNNQEMTFDGTHATRLPGLPALLRNDSFTDGNWLKVQLAGTPPLHRHGIGSRVYVTTTDGTQMRELNASTSFLAHGPNRIAHFGLGNSLKAQEVRAEWNHGHAVRRRMVLGRQSITLPSPSLTLDKTVYDAGESVYLDAAANVPAGALIDWLAQGEVLPNPLQLNLTEPGPQVWTLRIYESGSKEPTLFEDYRIRVRPMSFLSIEHHPQDHAVSMQWYGFGGRIYQMERCRDVSDPVWEEEGAPIEVTVTGIQNTTVQMGSGNWFFRLRLL